MKIVKFYKALNNIRILGILNILILQYVLIVLSMSIKELGNNFPLINGDDIFSIAVVTVLLYLLFLTFNKKRFSYYFSSSKPVQRKFMKALPISTIYAYCFFLLSPLVVFLYEQIISIADWLYQVVLDDFNAMDEVEEIERVKLFFRAQNYSSLVTHKFLVFILLSIYGNRISDFDKFFKYYVVRSLYSRTASWIPSVKNQNDFFELSNMPGRTIINISIFNLQQCLESCFKEDVVNKELPSDQQWRELYYNTSILLARCYRVLGEDQLALNYLEDGVKRPISAEQYMSLFETFGIYGSKGDTERSINCGNLLLERYGRTQPFESLSLPMQRSLRGEMLLVAIAQAMNLLILGNDNAAKDLIHENFHVATFGSPLPGRLLELQEKVITGVIDRPKSWTEIREIVKSSYRSGFGLPE